MTIPPWIQRLRQPSAAAGSAARSQSLLPWLVAGALVYGLLTAYALRSLRSSDAQLARLEAERQAMTELADEARGLRSAVKGSAPRVNPGAEALRATLPPGVVVTGAGRVLTATLQDVRAGVLARWLVQLRTVYRIDVTEAHLSASTPGAWSGTLKLQGAEGSDGN